VSNRWTVKTKPVPENPTPAGKNESGIVIYLRDGNSGQDVEVSRVLFVRRNAANKSVGFKRQLLKELDKAYEATEVLNDSYMEQDAKDKAKTAAVEEAEKRRNKLLESLQEETPRM
jgi:hypothetical protein